MLIEPVPLGQFARLRNKVLRRIAVQVFCRRKETPPIPDMSSVLADIGPHALERLAPIAA